MDQFITRSSVLCVLSLLLLTGCRAAQDWTAEVHTSQSVANQFLERMSAHQYSTAYELFPSGTDKKFSLQKLQGTWEAIERENGRVKSWKFYKVFSRKSKYTDLAYVLEFERTNKVIALRIIEENQKFVISGIEIK